jgi:membrane associated rhomboid family serine protease
MNSMLGGFSGLKPVVKNLLVINVMMFVIMLLARYLGNIDLNAILGLYFPKSDYFRPYQVVTHMFMHANFWHIFMNMWALVLFGQILESVWGPKRFLIYYLVTGLGAAFTFELIQSLQYANLLTQITPENLQFILDRNYEALSTSQNQENLPALIKMIGILNGPTIGASGAVFGLLLAFGMLFPNTPLMIMFIPIPIKAKYFVMGYGAVELYYAVMQYSNNAGVMARPGSNIAHVAHLGGMLFGYIMIKYWRKTTKTLY